MVAEVIMAHLPACRESWWTTRGSRREKLGKAAAGVVSAGYDAGNGEIALTHDDGRTLALTAGQPIEEAEEW